MILPRLQQLAGNVTTARLSHRSTESRLEALGNSGRGRCAFAVRSLTPSLLLLVAFALLGIGQPARAGEPSTDRDFVEESFDQPDEPAEFPTPLTTPKQSTPPLAREPQWPTWSAAPAPSRQVFVAPDQYLLVRPSQGIGQDWDRATYVDHVQDEEDLDFHERTGPLPIDLQRADGFAPIGVFNANTLPAGGQMTLSYRYNQSWYRGNLDGTHSVSDATILGTYTLAPRKLLAETHVFRFQYAPTDDLTLQGVLPIVQRHMQFVNAAGNQSSIQVTDLSDIPLTAMYVLRRWNRQQLHLNFGVQIPVGINNTLAQQQQGFPNPTSPVLTYPMRTSDGTYDLLPGLTYTGQDDHWTWGLQSIGTLRLGRNSYDYRLGDQLNTTAWLSRRLNDSLAGSFRVDSQIWGNIHGADHGLNPALVPSNVPGLQGGRRVDLLFGVNSFVPLDGPFTGTYQHYFGFEAGFPVYQFLNGPQLRERMTLYANWTMLF